MMFRGRRGGFGVRRRILLFSLCCLFTSMATAADVVNQVKMAFVFNIAKFVAWPVEAASSPKTLHVCFYRQGLDADDFAQIDGKIIQQKVIRQVLISQLNDRSQCHIVFIPAAEVARFSQEYSQLSVTVSERPILTIADLTTLNIREQALEGVAINLVRRGTGISFEVNLQEVDKRQLKISSELLKLAYIVGNH